MRSSILSENAGTTDYTKEPMFFGEGLGIARTDVMRYPIFEKLTQAQLGFFWRPQEVDISMDRAQFESLEPHEKHIFTANLRYQMLLDSIQGRSPNVAFLPIASLPEVEKWIETWSFSETIHSDSYMHIIRNVYNDPSVIIDNVLLDEEIEKRAKDITKYYDELVEYGGYFNKIGGFGTIEVDGVAYDVSEEKMWDLWFSCMFSVAALEAIRFYVSFGCAFAFGERMLMEGNAKIIKLIARDENLHKTGSKHFIEYALEYPVARKVFEANKDKYLNIILDAYHQEVDWLKYVFKDGGMPGLNEEIMTEYLTQITNRFIETLRGTGLESPLPKSKTDALPWMSTWLTNTDVQVAPQETEISGYLTGALGQDFVADDTFWKRVELTAKDVESTLYPMETMTIDLWPNVVKQEVKVPA